MSLPNKKERQYYLRPTPPIPSDGTPAGSVPVSLWTWMILCALAADGVVAISYGIQSHRPDYERRCETIAIMGPCTSSDLFGHGLCRVETASGAHATVTAPAMVGDEACWREPVKE